MTAMLRRLPLMRDRRAAIAVMLAVMLATFIILVACAVDIAFFIFARSQLNSAADAAAIHAVRIAAQQYAAGGTSTDAQTAGIAAGKQWFAAQLGNVRGATLTASSPTVSVNYQTQPGGFVSTVAFSATVPTYVGSFMTPNWTITGSAASQFTNNYLEILMMLDNSSSMQIGASDADMLQMMQLTPCSPLNVTYNNKSATYNSIMSYSAYTCPSNNETTISCPVKKPPNAPVQQPRPCPYRAGVQEGLHSAVRRHLPHGRSALRLRLPFRQQQAGRLRRRLLRPGAQHDRNRQSGSPAL